MKRVHPSQFSLSGGPLAFCHVLTQGKSFGLCWPNALGFAGFRTISQTNFYCLESSSLWCSVTAAGEDQDGPEKSMG